MKKLMMLAVLFVGLSQTTQAQVDVTLNPLGILFGNLSLGADIAINENFSIEPTIGFGAKNRRLIGYKSTRIPISIFGKYYFNPDKGTDKFYASLWLRYVNRNFDWDEDNIGGFNVNYSQNKMGAGIGIGYKVVSDKGVVFDIGFGMGRAFLNNRTFETEIDEDLVNTIDWPDLILNGKIGLGFRFGG